MTALARWAEIRLNYSFEHPELLTQALTHRSASKDNYERLVSVKNEYDLSNLFRVNQNIKPTA